MKRFETIPDSLTKENFWNAALEAYPAQVEKFCAWVDSYKERVNWDKLFNAERDMVFSSGFDKVPSAPKFHDLPLGMQLGIFMQYVAESDPKNAEMVIGIYIDAVTNFLKAPVK